MQDRSPPARQNPLATHGRTIHWVMCGRRLGKNFLTLLQHWSGAVMCPACLCGRVWPLALMLCADRVPIVSTHFKVR